MTNRLDCAGHVLEGPGVQTLASWTVDGEPCKDAETAVEMWFARIYSADNELAQAITKAANRLPLGTDD